MVKNSMSYSQKFEVQLNPEQKIIVMKPGQDLFLRFAPKIDKVMNALFGGEAGTMSWAEDIEKYPDLGNKTKYEYVTGVVKPILLYCVRNPSDYRKRLLVDEGLPCAANQEYYDDFNPEFDAKTLKAQGMFNGDDNEKVLTPQLTLFFIILRKSGWINIPEEQEEVESFPDEQTGDGEASGVRVVPSEPVQPETE